MSIWIALLRGINVGGKNILKMDDLKQTLEKLNLQNVQTYIQSGNVVFSSKRKAAARLEDEIANAIKKKHGFRPQLFVLNVDRLRKAMQANPFPAAEADPKSLHLFFLCTTAKSPDKDAIRKAKLSTEKYELTSDVFYLYAPDGTGRSKLAANVEKYLGVPTTARNWRTVLKLTEMADSATNS